MITEKETYRFLHITFKVYPLYEYAKKNLQPEPVSLEDIAKGYGFKNYVEKTGQVSMFHIDTEYAKTLTEKDLEQPILIIKLPKDYGNLMIDGLHRSFNLWCNGQKTIQAYYIKNLAIVRKNSNLKELKL